MIKMIMNSILRSSVPIHVTTQYIEILTVQGLTLKCIKMTYTSHLSLHSSQDLESML
jgi:hypothetical protein